LTLFLKLLKPGGRAAVIVPDSVLFGNSRAHKEIRRMLVEEQKLDAVVSLPSGVFKPYAGVSTAILLFTKTNSGGTDTVWFYDMTADGWSLDDTRKPLLDAELLGTHPARALTREEHTKNNLADVLARWHEREGAERNRSRTEQSFTVTRMQIADAEYDLNLNKHKEIVREKIEYPAPHILIHELKQLEAEMQADLDQLEKVLKWK